MPRGLFLRLREAHDRASVDDFWDVWSAGAEEGLFRAYWRAGGPVAGGAQRYLGRGRLRVRRRQLGGRSVGGVGSSRLYRASQGDDVDVSSAQYFVNSSLAPVLLFRRRSKSVADVLKGIRQHGFSQDRLDALHRYWAAVCRQGPCGPVVSLEPWAGWIPPDLHGFFHWVMTSMNDLNRFVKQVVVTRRDSKLLQWGNWLREDMGSRPYAWLRPDYVPLAPFLVVKDSEQGTSRILVEPHLIHAEFRKAWLPFFCRSGHPVVTVDQFLSFVHPFLP